MLDLYEVAYGNMIIGEMKTILQALVMKQLSYLLVDE